MPANRSRVRLSIWATRSLFSVYLLATGLAAHAAPVLDQSFDATGGDLSLAVIGSQSGAQVFTAGLSGRLSSVGLMLNQDAPPSSSFTISILDVTAGVPNGSGSALFSQNFAASVLPFGAFNFTFTDFDISTGNVMVSAGQQYAIAVTFPTGTGLRNWLLWDASNAPGGYSGGDLFYGDGDLATTWTVRTDNGMNYDAGFRTFVDASQIPEPTTLALLGLGLAGLAATRRRKQ